MQIKKPYLYFWAHNQKEEKKQFQNLIDYFVKHLEKYPDAISIIITIMKKPL